MSCIYSLFDLPVSPDELHQGRLILDEIRSVTSLNAILFDHLRVSLVPGGASSALPRNTRVRASKHAQSDGRVLELYVGILFHCMGFTVLSCGGGPADGGVDVTVRDNKNNIIAIQCKQYSRAVVGYNIGLQLIGAMYTTGANVGVLITSAAASQDVRDLAGSMESVRGGEFRMHVWQGEQLARLLGRWSADIADAVSALIDDALADGELCDRIRASQPHGYCIRHSIRPARGDGECPSNCKPISLASSRCSYNLPTSSPPPHIPLRRAATPVPLPPTTCTVNDNDDVTEELESISDDGCEDDGRLVNRHGNLRLDPCTTPACPRQLASFLPVARATPGCSSPSHQQHVAVLWTEAEERELQKCVALVGGGKWSEILELSDILRSRGKTAIKIRDKWKNMRKRQLRTPSTYK